MKFLSSQLAFFLNSKHTRRNIRFLIRFLFLLVSLITFYSIVFHYIMEVEGRDYSWTTGFYWTLTVMSTLGFGDITFTTDLGRFFSIIVLMSASWAAEKLEDAAGSALLGADPEGNHAAGTGTTRRSCGGQCGGSKVTRSSRVRCIQRRRRGRRGPRRRWARP